MSDRRPNVILILADDMGFSDLGCFGSEIRTPNLDAMAQRGAALTAMYNGARCCPTRAALLTGLYATKAGVGHMGADLGGKALLRRDHAIRSPDRVNAVQRVKDRAGIGQRPRHRDRCPRQPQEKRAEPP